MTSLTLFDLPEIGKLSLQDAFAPLLKAQREMREKLEEEKKLTPQGAEEKEEDAERGDGIQRIWTDDSMLFGHKNLVCKTTFNSRVDFVSRGKLLSPSSFRN